MTEKKEDLKQSLEQIDDKIQQLQYERERINGKIEKLQAQRQRIHDEILNEQSQELANKDWSKRTFKWSDKVQKTLEDVFHLDDFRPQQLEAINATLSKVDCIVVMPTGGGKSLCYQLPALIGSGITIVISPLLALMEDQCMALKRLKISGEMLSSTSDKDDVKWIHDALANSCDVKLLYVTPERLAKSKRFMAALQKCHQRGKLDRIAIDEVHCCSQWGHDFRPDYKYLTVLKSLFSDVPIIGLTATATTQVLADVQSILDISGCLLIRSSFNRPNLYYEVREKPGTNALQLEELENMINSKYNNESGIIYTTTIKECMDIAKDLSARGCRVAPYHAEMDTKVRSKVHKKWLANEHQVVVATVAFGMGIDKPDVRFVVHLTIAKSIENYYQESGRAGRNGEPADCILFYKLADAFRLSTMVFSTQTGLKNLYNLITYCLDKTRCRRDLISTYFNETWTKDMCNKSCDNCRTTYVTREVDVTQHLQDIYALLKHAAGMDQQLTAGKLMDAWFQRGGAVFLRIKTLKPPGITREFGEEILARLIIMDYLKEAFHFTAYSTISYIKRGTKADLLNNSSHRVFIEAASKVNMKEDVNVITSKRTIEESSTSEMSSKKGKMIVISDSESD